MEPSALVKQDARLLDLPSEILHQILSLVECQSLVSLSRTCRKLRAAAQGDLLWTDLLREHIPALDFPTDPYPSTCYRDLYITHHPYWFVPRNRIWISNEQAIGRIMLCRFDPRRGCIEGYRLLADRGPSSDSMIWPHKPTVLIHAFKPRVHLWLDDPILKLRHDPVPFNTKQGWWEGEIKMSVGRPGHNTSASFFLARNLPERTLHPSVDVWPPFTIPGMPRVRAFSKDKFQGKGHKPQKYEDISQSSFRMRHWSQFSANLSVLGVRVGEEVSTWSTLDPALYTPTPKKPYQGIFVGDYAGHGCEFLLVMHTDKAPPPPETSGMRMFMSFRHREEEEEEEEEALPQLITAGKPPPPVPEDAGCRDDENILRGALEAVKLTGDPNVPRGEHTFIADDISKDGLLRIATEQPFVGARVVKSRGHVAARGFVHDEFIPSQLLMINHNRLAQYWVPFGHISFYERVDIDTLMRRTFHGGA